MIDNSAGAEAIDVVVVGAGQSGLAQSFCLSERGIEHVVLERERAFAAWYRRWDSLRMNTPNWMNRLPGARRDFCPGERASAYAGRTDAIAYFEDYVEAAKPPLREKAKVVRVRECGGGRWLVEVELEAGALAYRTSNVVICTGQQACPRLPPVAVGLPAGVFSIHSSEYRNSEQVPEGQVLVVGSGSSGVQICEELAKSGRFERVHLVESGNFILPWRILGFPTHSLLRAFGISRIERNSWLGRRVRKRLSAGGDVATPPSPAALSRVHSVNRLGRALGVSDGALRFEGGASVALANLSTIWCTGFDPDFSFIEVADPADVFDANGDPLHARGVIAGAPGLYFVGLRFQHTSASHLIYGAGDDARFIAEHIAGRC